MSIRNSWSRRDWLWQAGGGLGGVALASLLAADGRLLGDESKRTSPLAPRATHFVPRAKHVIVLFCAGAVSQVDTYDYKPELIKRAGTPFDTTGKLEFFASKPGNCVPSYWPFRQHGQSGRWMSDLLPHLSGCVDDMAFVYSMQSKSAVHAPAMFMMNTGFIQPGFPSMGAWTVYGLGSENEDLPAFVVLPDSRGVPPGGPANWNSGFLPAVFQGTSVRSEPGKPPIADLFPPDPPAAGADPEVSRQFLQRMNSRHAAARPEDTELEARILAYELAARLQLSAPEATNIAGETAATHQLYGVDDPVTGDFGRRCLLARRLVERGVRFVQVWCGADNTAPPRANWDGHEDILDNHGLHGRIFDLPAAALLKDLKARGLLDETLVICCSEFGRVPAAEGGGKGRDHNPHAFTVWMAGGGVKAGASYGQSDELGYRVAENPAYCYDLHATALHLLGLDHEQLTFYHNGIRRRLTDVHGQVLHGLL
jgi:Protein of unknown function (DUF1501)